jgi:hypothetical protein
MASPLSDVDVMFMMLVKIITVFIELITGPHISSLYALHALSLSFI